MKWGKSVIALFSLLG